MIIYNYEAAK